ncbi:MAG: malonyl-CoA O-methyltransferase [Candidatus Midichloriaceae bacterium]|jgi:malonyl-CoA O-methyltransferase
MKELIKKRFNSASDSYDKVAQVQKESAKLLVHYLLQNFPFFFPKNILDLGSGTGYVVESLLDHYPNSHYTINDFSEKMLKKAKEKFIDYKDFTFFEGDMESVIFKNHDLIISNLAFQWLDNFENCIRKFHSQSKIIAFSCLLEDTFKEWADFFIANNLSSPIKTYPNLEELKVLLNKITSRNYKIYSKKFTHSFTDTKSFFSYLKRLGASVGCNDYKISEIKKVLNEENFTFDVTYSIAFAILSK